MRSAPLQVTRVSHEDPPVASNRPDTCGTARDSLISLGDGSHAAEAGKVLLLCNKRGPLTHKAAYKKLCRRCSSRYPLSCFAPMTLHPSHVNAACRLKRKYHLRVLESPDALTYHDLDGISLVVLASPQHPLHAAEVAMLQQWVVHGRSLLVLAEEGGDVSSGTPSPYELQTPPPREGLTGHMLCRQQYRCPAAAFQHLYQPRHSAPAVGQQRAAPCCGARDRAP